MPWFFYLVIGLLWYYNCMMIIFFFRKPDKEKPKGKLLHYVMQMNKIYWNSNIVIKPSFNKMGLPFWRPYFELHYLACLKIIVLLFKFHWRLFIWHYNSTGLGSNGLAPEGWQLFLKCKFANVSCIVIFMTISGILIPYTWAGYQT